MIKTHVTWRPFAIQVGAIFKTHHWQSHREMSQCAGMPHAARGRRRAHRDLLSKLSKSSITGFTDGSRFELVHLKFQVVTVGQQSLFQVTLHQLENDHPMMISHGGNLHGHWQ